MAEAQVVDIATEGKRKLVVELRNEIDNCYWNFAAALHEVYQESLYQTWGYENWKDYIASAEVDISYRKGKYLIDIYGYFSSQSSETQDFARSLGWSKAKELVGIVNDENLAEWKKRVEGLTVQEIIDLKKQGRDEGDDAVVGDSDGASSSSDSTSTRKAFTLFPDQLENVERALKLASELANSSKEGHLLDMICLEFLASNSGMDNVDEYLTKVQNVTGVSLIGYDKKSDTIVFGGDTLDEISADSE